MPEDSRNPFLEARNAGLSPIPVDTSTKRPLVRWAQYQDHAADFDECVEWGKQFDEGRCGIGVVCGAVSGRLICIDIEAAFVYDDDAHDHMHQLAEAFRQAGCYHTWMDAMAGYMETTPSGGLHVLVRLEGEGPCEGNRKLISAPDGKTLVETRGEGGYVIVAPSMNGERGWCLVHSDHDHEPAWWTAEDWATVAGACASLDANPPAPLRPVPTSSTPSILRLGADSWIEEAKRQLPDYADVLAQHGWTPGGRDSFGVHYTRPGKNPRLGHSASLSDDGYLWVHSTNASLPTKVGIDVVDYLCWSNAGRLPTRDERVEYLRALRPLAAGGAAGQAAEASPATPSLNLPEEFWQQPDYPFLDQIRTAALARRLSPDAVWEAIKCFYAAAIPWNHRLPDDGTMDYISLVVGASGAGKSRAKSEAYNLLSRLWALDSVRFPVPPGSGEGMTEVFLDRSKDAVSKYALRGVGFYADEGKWLLDISSRPGNTTLQALKQLWSGELTGSVAATADRHRWLAPRDVRATMLIAATPDVAAQFLRSDLSDEGLPQRISWGWAHYPHPDERPEHPGPLQVQVWRPMQNLYQIDVDPTLAEMIDAERLAASRGTVAATHEGHATYAKLKTAAILAHLAGRMTVTMTDWDLSQLDWDTTRQIRTYLLSTQTRAAEDRNVALGAARAHQRIAETNVYVEKAVHSLVTKLKLAGRPLSLREIKSHLRQFKRRHGVDHRSVLDLAETRGLIHAAPPDGWGA